MIRSTWIGALVVSLACIVPCPGQGQGKVQPECYIMVKEDGKPSVKCKVVKCWTEKDGSRVRQVQVVDTGEMMTILEEPTVAGATPPRPKVYHLGSGGTRLPGVPTPPSSARAEIRPPAPTKESKPATRLGWLKGSDERTKTPEKPAGSVVSSYRPALPVAKPSSLDPITRPDVFGQSPEKAASSKAASSLPPATGATTSATVTPASLASSPPPTTGGITPGPVTPASLAASLPPPTPARGPITEKKPAIPPKAENAGAKGQPIQATSGTQPERGGVLSRLFTSSTTATSSPRSEPAATKELVTKPATDCKVCTPGKTEKGEGRSQGGTPVRAEKEPAGLLVRVFATTPKTEPVVTVPREVGSPKVVQAPATREGGSFWSFTPRTQAAAPTQPQVYLPRNEGRPGLFSRVYAGPTGLDATAAGRPKGPGLGSVTAAASPQVIGQTPMGMLVRMPDGQQVVVPSDRVAPGTPGIPVSANNAFTLSAGQNVMQTGMMMPPGGMMMPQAPGISDGGPGPGVANAFTRGTATNRPIPSDMGTPYHNPNAFLMQGMGGAEYRPGGMPMPGWYPPPQMAGYYPPQMGYPMPAAGYYPPAMVYHGHVPPVMAPGRAVASDAGKTSAAGLLAQLRDAVKPSEREMAADDLARVDWKVEQQVVPALVQGALIDPAPLVRASCLRTLGRLKANTMPVLNAAETLKKDKDVRVRQEAEETLATLKQK